MNGLLWMQSNTAVFQVNTATYCPSVSLSWSTVHWCYRETGPLTTCLTHTHTHTHAARSFTRTGLESRWGAETQTQHLDTHHESTRLHLRTQRWVRARFDLDSNVTMYPRRGAFDPRLCPRSAAALHDTGVYNATWATSAYGMFGRVIRH